VILTVHELKRLACNAAELMMLSAQLHADGIQLELLAGPLAWVYDLHGMGSALFAVLVVAAQLDREYIREKTLKGHRGGPRRTRARSAMPSQRAHEMLPILVDHRRPTASHWKKATNERTDRPLTDVSEREPTPSFASKALSMMHESPPQAEPPPDAVRGRSTVDLRCTSLTSRFPGRPPRLLGRPDGVASHVEPVVLLIMSSV
jgi:hypothetical protein